ncbi:MAG: cupin domain-containing protein [Marinicellaceae bacterium]
MNHNENKIQNIIEKLNLMPHPEGGYYREIYRSEGTIQSESLTNAFSGTRNYATSIYFLLTSDTFSAFHKINQDEIWHFYDGSPIQLHIISEKGKHTQHVIGKDIFNNQVPQLVVPAYHWFAAKTIHQNDYSLVGCGVSPGFDFKDFTLPSREELLKKYPQHKKVILAFTRE